MTKIGHPNTSQMLYKLCTHSKSCLTQKSNSNIYGQPLIDARFCLSSNKVFLKREIAI